MNAAIYNEIDPFAGNWLTELVAKGHIASGRVERRSIADLSPDDVAGPGQRHFFAGIGVWSHALRLAGVSDDADVWTGSCPCQPFSIAGEGRGFDDPRHLWPAWHALIRECHPSIVFGEQVAGGDGLTWLDAVRSDLEGCGYAFGASSLCAAGVGAPHIRQRLFFVAYAVRTGRAEGRAIAGIRSAAGRRSAGVVGHTNGGARNRRQRLHVQSRRPQQADADSRRTSTSRIMGDSDGVELRLDTGAGSCAEGASRHVADSDDARASGATRGHWRDADWIPCSDGKARPVEPGSFPLADGTPQRVGRLRGYGNAIVAPLAATFIQAALEAIE